MAYNLRERRVVEIIYIDDDDDDDDLNQHQQHENEHGEFLICPIMT